MRIAAAQLRPVRGDIETNIAKHLALVQLAAKASPDVVLFPELSLTGYEPSLASDLAVTDVDEIGSRLYEFCDELQVSIGVGLPLATPGLPRIGYVFFSPGNKYCVFNKRYLHEDELSFFSPSTSSAPPVFCEVGLAICYELSVAQHAVNCVDGGATIYAASVAKTASGIENAKQRLEEICKQFQIPAIMANSVGACEEGTCTGSSAVWDASGGLMDQLDTSQEGFVMLDTVRLTTQFAYL